MRVLGSATLELLQTLGGSDAGKAGSAATMLAIMARDSGKATTMAALGAFDRIAAQLATAELPLAVRRSMFVLLAALVTVEANVVKLAASQGELLGHVFSVAAMGDAGDPACVAMAAFIAAAAAATEPEVEVDDELAHALLAAAESVAEPEAAADLSRAASANPDNPPHAGVCTNTGCTSCGEPAFLRCAECEFLSSAAETRLQFFSFGSALSE
ncbi:uncharacterized protein AMSG_04330 [Thecamonas trahens ATCC 50062]|uniref:Uncharacterized protein n=1 Tax=Thecamonas trahens ATCC 50062 TaxID=461836 RepID=A0A0L0D7E0_THETB|nr:hypothetical protein AMSG_04330 [Thecamonas trahens ATCC 50062]KNC48100.1 hypothetical protein AMSG_04330 [Thecamonas trahens ATCC 50062]|eukprot:XP_013758676.1 hypothetical protein AMSG_04330 [Thecamonas trahens ATCC 50062]